MKKRTVILAGILTMLAIITSIGLTAMLKKPIQKGPMGRTEYQITDQEMKELEKELKELEEEKPPIIEEEETDITIQEST